MATDAKKEKMVMRMIRGKCAKQVGEAAMLEIELWVCTLSFLVPLLDAPQKPKPPQKKYTPQEIRPASPGCGYHVHWVDGGWLHFTYAWNRRLEIAVPLVASE